MFGCNSRYIHKRSVVVLTNINIFRKYTNEASNKENFLYFLYTPHELPYTLSELYGLAMSVYIRIVVKELLNENVRKCKYKGRSTLTYDTDIILLAHTFHKESSFPLNFPFTRVLEDTN